MRKKTPLPSHRASRLLKLGGLVGRIAGEALSQGAANLIAGNPLRASDLLLTPTNARHMAERLAQMRGAVMKVGQLLSMEAGDYLPPELTHILATLRESAEQMPFGQLNRVLEEAWGKDWQRHFERFYFTPIASASIGQVHEAISRQGEHLAIKVQYPGIRQSIDSDVDNVSALFKLLRLLPPGYDLAPLLAEAKRQLHQEADYLAEADCIAEYRQCLSGQDGFELPRVDRGLTTPKVLAMSFVKGVPVESMATADQALRNQLAGRLLNLVLKELFEWGLVQTDANFGNYRYQAESGRIGLLDFGATRRYSVDMITQLGQLMAAARSADLSIIEACALELGYLRAGEASAYRHGLCQMISTVAEPLRSQGGFDFSESDLSRRIAQQAIELRLQQRYMHLPPTELLFLHRKFAGTYLLCARLRAKVDVGRLAEPYLQGY